MKSLKYLALYNERLREEFKDAISAKDCCGMLSENDAHMALRYMESGLVLWEFVSPTVDLLGSGEDIRNVIYTDGCFVWDGLLSFWVKRYRIALPDEFLQHIRANGTVNVERLAEHKADLMTAFRNALPIVMR